MGGNAVYSLPPWLVRCLPSRSALLRRDSRASKRSGSRMSDTPENLIKMLQTPSYWQPQSPWVTQQGLWAAGQCTHPRPG